MARKLYTTIPIREGLNPQNFIVGNLARNLFEDNFFEDEALGVQGYIKVWSGSAWALKPVKYWTGSAWVQKPLKYWNGSAWAITPAV